MKSEHNTNRLGQVAADLIAGLLQSSISGGQIWTRQIWTIMDATTNCLFLFFLGRGMHHWHHLCKICHLNLKSCRVSCCRLHGLFVGVKSTTWWRFRSIYHSNHFMKTVGAKKYNIRSLQRFSYEGWDDNHLLKRSTSGMTCLLAFDVPLHGR